MSFSADDSERIDQFVNLLKAQDGGERGAGLLAGGEGPRAQEWAKQKSATVLMINLVRAGSGLAAVPAAASCDVLPEVLVGHVAACLVVAPAETPLQQPQAGTGRCTLPPHTCPPQDPTPPPPAAGVHHGEDG